MEETTTPIGRVAIQSSRWFKGGAWLLILVSAGHSYWHLSFYGPLASSARPEGERATLAAMSALKMPYPGPSRSLLDFQVGFSAIMAIVILGIGILNLIFEHSLRKSGLGIPSSVALANCVLALFVLGASFVWLAPMPLPFLLGASICFGLSRRTPVADARA